MKRTWIVVGIAALLLWVTAAPVAGEEAAGERAETLWARAIAAEKERDVEAEDALVALEDDAVPVLVAALGSSRSWPRTRAARLLERLGPRGAAAVPALIDALYDRTWTTRRQAAYALAAMGAAGRAALPALWRAALRPPQLAHHPKDEASDHDAYAWALLRLDGNSAETAREILLRGRVNDVLPIYLRTDPDRLRPVLTPLLGNASWRVRNKAIWTLHYVVWKLDEREPWLGILGDVIATDPVPSVRRSAVLVANRLVVQNEVVLESSLLVPALASTDPALRILAADSLACLTPKGAATIAALLTALQDSEPAVRRGAALALGRTGQAGLRPTLEPLLADARVAPAAAVALVGLGSTEAAVLVSVARAAFEQRGVASGTTVLLRRGRSLGGSRRQSVDLGRLAEHALVGAGPKAIAAIEPYLTARTTAERERALLLLGRLGEPGVERVKAELTASQLESRREAATVLVSLGESSRAAVHLLLDAAVDESERELYPDAVISDQIAWRRTTIELLSAADAKIVPDLLDHARALVPDGWAEAAAAKGVVPAPPPLDIHAEVLRGLGDAARGPLERSLEDEPLAPWIRHVLQTLPGPKR